MQTNNKLRDALVLALSLLDLEEGVPYKTVSQKDLDFMKSALAAPPRNCDKVKDHSDAIGKFEKWMGFSPKTADEQDAFFKEHWFEFAMWLIDMNESEVKDGGK